MMTKDIADILAAAGHGTTDVSIFYTGWIPDTPKVLIYIRQYAGSSPPLSSPRLRCPGLQIQTRDVDYTAGMARAIAIDRTLSVLANYTFGDGVYLKVRPIQEVFDLGWENEMITFVQNFDVEVAATME
jgi:hypothetical protein